MTISKPLNMAKIRNEYYEKLEIPSDSFLSLIDPRPK